MCLKPKEEQEQKELVRMREKERDRKRAAFSKSSKRITSVLPSSPLIPLSPLFSLSLSLSKSSAKKEENKRRKQKKTESRRMSRGGRERAFCLTYMQRDVVKKRACVEMNTHKPPPREGKRGRGEWRNPHTLNLSAQALGVFF